MFYKNCIQPLAGIQDFSCMDVNIGGLSLETSKRLVDHYPGMRQAVAFPLLTAGEQQGTHARGLSHAHRADGRLDKLHGIVDGESGGNRTARRIDIEMDILVRILRLEKQ